MIRFAACLGIHVRVCDAHHPQQNGFVERYNRTSQEECLALDRPADLTQAREVTEVFVRHSNEQRPHQGLSCGNRPPRTAFPILARLAALPVQVDPDSWLASLDGVHLERKVDAHGMISLDLKRYSVSSRLVAHRVVVHLDAATRSLRLFHEQRFLKSIPLRGLVGRVLSFEQFLAHLLHQARAQARLRSLQQRKYRTSALTGP